VTTLSHAHVTERPASRTFITVLANSHLFVCRFPSRRTTGAALDISSEAKTTAAMTTTKTRRVGVSSRHRQTTTTTRRTCRRWTNRRPKAATPRLSSTSHRIRCHSPPASVRQACRSPRTSRRLQPRRARRRLASLDAPIVAVETT
jgi:hypothetical protein